MIDFFAISPDSKTIAYSWSNLSSQEKNEKEQICIRSLETGELVRTIHLPSTGHVPQDNSDSYHSPGPIEDLAFSPDGKHIAICTCNGYWQDASTVYIWATESGQMIKQLTGNIGKINSIAFSPDSKKIAASGQDKRFMKNYGIIEVWEIDSGKRIFSKDAKYTTKMFLYSHDQGAIRSICFTPTGDSIIGMHDAMSCDSHSLPLRVHEEDVVISWNIVAQKENYRIWSGEQAESYNHFHSDPPDIFSLFDDTFEDLSVTFFPVDVYPLLSKKEAPRYFMWVA